MPRSREFSQHRIAALLCLALCCAPIMRAQDQDKLYTATRGQLEAVKVVLAQESAWNRGDLDAFTSRYKDDPETQAMLGGSVKGLANIRSAFRINFPNREAMGTIEYSAVEARELGENFAMATGKYHLERSKKGGGVAEGTFIEVMEKTDKGWLIIFSQTT